MGLEMGGGRPSAMKGDGGRYGEGRGEVRCSKKGRGVPSDGFCQGMGS